MRTEKLVAALAADLGQGSAPLRGAWLLALAGAALAACAVFFLTIGPRPDLEAAAQTWRFLFKFVVTIALAASAGLLLWNQARPGTPTAKSIIGLFAAPAILGAVVLLELLVLPPGQWLPRLEGTNSRLCLTFIPLIGAVPLGLLLRALRHGAPTSPAFAGGVAGLLAGGIAATFYAAHCIDDSPLFVAAWYTIAVLILAGAGAILAPRVARW